MPKVSIVIPTCNRSSYLLEAMKAILENVQNAEIIVSDNSDNDDIRALLAQHIQSNQVRYQFLSEPVSVVENFERSVILATGEFVICLGDDDCIGPGFNDVVDWVCNSNIDAVFSYGDRFIANYFWPGIKSRFFGDAYEARLFVKAYSGHAVKIEGVAALRAAANKLGNGVGNMPRIYHGLVRRTLLDHIRVKYGAIFGGVSPDIYSAALISIEAKLIYQIDAPFVIPGAGVKSTAGQGAAHTDRGSLLEVDHIRRFGSDLLWSPLIPAYYSPHNVWAHSMLCALQKLPTANVHSNLMGVILKGWLSGRKYKLEISGALAEVINQQGRITALCDLAKSIFHEVLSIIKRIYWKYLKKTLIHAQINDIGTALNLLKLEQSNNNFDLSKILNKTVR